MYKGFNIIKDSSDALFEINKEKLEKLLNQKIDIIDSNISNIIDKCYILLEILPYSYIFIIIS